MTELASRRRFAQWLEERFFLRFHIGLILVGSFLAGLLASMVLLSLGLESLALRYGLAVGVGYLAFLCLVRLWIEYVTPEKDDPRDEGLADLVDAGLDAVDTAGDALHLMQHAASAGGGGSDAATPGADDSALSLGEALSFDELGVLIAFIVVVLASLAAAVYMLYAGPAILAEAAFNALLAGGLARRARQLESQGWAAGVCRATVWPFLGVLATAIVFGWVAGACCPDAVRLRDVAACLRAW